MFKISFKRYILFLIFLIIITFIISLYIKKVIKELPSIYTLEDYSPRLVTKIFDRNGNLITELFTEKRTLIPLNEIPVDLQNAVLAIEDDKFFKHWGISFRGIIRATINNIIKRRVSQGGSTITQQLAKTIFLTPERTFKRKIKELLLTLSLEKNFSKEEILQFYLNQIYFGAGAYGVEAAAKTYFSKHVKDLTLPESAMLAGLPRAPNYYSPFADPKRAFYRRANVLRRMRKLKFITKEEEEKANAFPITTKNINIPVTTAPYFIEYLRLLLEPKYGNSMIYHGGLSIYTTLDINMQKAAEQILKNALDRFDKERLSYYQLKKSTPVPVQGALIAIDPKTGGIRAMVGGRDFLESQFNRAVSAKRQPGSCFKPFVYTAALENGFTPTSILDDIPRVYINNGRDWTLASNTTDFLLNLSTEVISDPMKVWVPQNYGNKYHGKVLLRSAIEHSLNMCAIQVLEEIGTLRAIDYARRMGITSPLTNTLSLALGASDLTLIEITSAFSVFASGGVYTKPYSIIRIEDRNGTILEENLPFEKEVLSPQISYIMTNLLQGVVNNGTGRAAKALGRPCAGKTGTTNDCTDAWFIGYTPQLAAGVWVGYDDHKTLGDKMTGGRVACPIWTEFMKTALIDESIIPFKPPDGIVFSLIDPKTGLLALSLSQGAYLEAFIKGTEPKDYYQKTITPTKEGINIISSEEEETGF